MAEVVTKSCKRCGAAFEVAVRRGSVNKAYCSARCRYPAAKLDGSPQSRGGVAAAKVRAALLAPGPATSDRVYDDAEAEFLKRVADYRAKTGKTFPTCTEMFRIVLGMGYRRG